MNPVRILLTTTSFQDTPGIHHEMLAAAGFEITVVALSENRGPASVAVLLYQEADAARDRRGRLARVAAALGALRDAIGSDGGRAAGARSSLGDAESELASQAALLSQTTAALLDDADVVSLHVDGRAGRAPAVGPRPGLVRPRS